MDPDKLVQVELTNNIIQNSLLNRTEVSSRVSLVSEYEGAAANGDVRPVLPIKENILSKVNIHCNQNFTIIRLNIETNGYFCDGFKAVV